MRLGHPRLVAGRQGLIGSTLFESPHTELVAHAVEVYHIRALSVQVTDLAADPLVLLVNSAFFLFFAAAHEFLPLVGVLQLEARTLVDHLGSASALFDGGLVLLVVLLCLLV